MPNPYYDERQVEQWTTRDVLDAFTRMHIRVFEYPVSQLTEKKLPADIIFVDRGRSKIFGFQYKALYRNSYDNFRLNAKQHRKLRRFSWIFYGFLEIRDSLDTAIALHRLRVVRVTNVRPVPQRSEFRVALSSVRRYYRWGAFFERFRRCRLGVRVKSVAHLQRLVPPEIVRALGDVFIVSVDDRAALRLIPDRRRRRLNP